MMDSVVAPGLLTREEAARYLGIRPQTLAAWMCLGRYNLKAVKIGRSVRYRREDLDQFIERRTIRHSGELAEVGGDQ